MRIRPGKQSKTRFIRRCIGEAILVLLKETELAKLKVLAIASRAGVSRMTFYKYYASPVSALEDYLHIMIEEYLEELQSQNEPPAFFSYEQILYALTFFDQYRTFFLIMKKRGLYTILVDGINDFVRDNMPLTQTLSVYRRYAYAGTLLNCFIMWEENGKKESAEAVARTIFELYG